MSNWTPQLEERLKDRIEDLHRYESADYESLIAQAGKAESRRHIQLNLPQAVVTLAPQQLVFKEWGRGTGKTTDLARVMHECVTTMPRSTGLFIIPNYQFGLTRIIPSLVKGLEMFGLYQGLHYFIGERPPRAWRKSWGVAYEPPRNYKRYITFWNGTGCHLISHDVNGDGRGLNTDWIIGDEAALLDPTKLQENTDPTRRGTNARMFRGLKYWGYRMYVSSTPITPGGRWMLKYEDMAREKPADILYHRATCRYNLHNLRPGYLEEARADCYQLWVYEAEYEGIRPRFTTNNFYTLFDTDRHCYRTGTVAADAYLKPGGKEDCRGDTDLVASLPLILGGDWGAVINCLVVNQFLKGQNELRTLKSMFVLGDDQKIQDDLFQEFHDYYQYHPTKEIYLWYDNTGNNRTGNTRATRAEQARAQLSKLGWNVHLMTTGQVNPMHDSKHQLFTMLHRENDRRLPRHRMNYFRTRDLQASMAAAKAIPGRNGEVKKDKSSERRKSIQRQHATDLSDALDSVVWGMFSQLLTMMGASIPAPRWTRG